MIDDDLWLDADPTMSPAVNTILVKKGVRVSELVMRLSERNPIRVKQPMAGNWGAVTGGGPELEGVADVNPAVWEYPFGEFGPMLPSFNRKFASD